MNTIEFDGLEYKGQPVNTRWFKHKENGEIKKLIDCPEGKGKIVPGDDFIYMEVVAKFLQGEKASRVKVVGPKSLIDLFRKVKPGDERLAEGCVYSSIGKAAKDLEGYSELYLRIDPIQTA